MFYGVCLCLWIDYYQGFAQFLHSNLNFGNNTDCFC